MRCDYKGAFMELDITPNANTANPAYLQGMFGPQRASTTIESPLRIQLFLLEDANFTKSVFVCADIIGYDKSVVRSVRAAAARWGIRPEGVILNASHTHYAPGTVSNMPLSMGPFYANYTAQISQLITQNLFNLYQALEPCDIQIGKADARIGANRRLVTDEKVRFAPNASGDYVTDTPVLKVVLLESKRQILWVNHACHPTGLGPDSRISADFPGYLRAMLKKYGAADGVMFFQGAAGSSKQTVGRNGDLAFCSNAKDAQANGHRLAGQVFKAIKKPLSSVHGSLFCTREVIHLPIGKPPDIDMLQAMQNESNGNPAIREWCDKMLKNYPSARFPATLPMEIQLVALGNHVNIVTFPAEPTAELAMAIKSEGLLSDHDLILGYTNGLEGYIPTDKMISEGGYEVEQSHLVYQQPAAFKPGVESIVLKSIESCISKKEKTDAPNGYGRYHLASDEKRAFFVLSSGRCGTMTLARVFDLSTNATVWHHPQPDPVEDALMAWWKTIDRRQTFWKARSSVIHESWANGNIHGETDLLMTPFCDVIAEEIPQAKFIVLVRDPRDFVRSGMRRNYYQGHPWDVGRLRPKAGTSDYQRWNTMDQFEKICWLWSSTYKEIQARIQSINKANVTILRFEDIFSDSTCLKETFEFLGLEGFDEVAIKTLLSKKLNKQMTGEFPKKEDWPEIYHRTLWKHCGELAESFGYGYDDCPDGRKQQNKTTIWDYLKFEHQSYPKKPSPEIVMRSARPELEIDQKTRIVSMGSCFARNIALELMRREYDYIVTELPFNEFSAHWGQVFNTACMRQIFEYTFNEKWSPICRWWPKNDKVQDPFRRNIIYDRETRRDDFDKHKQSSSLALKGADIVILTLGLIETWRDKRDGMTYYRVPSPSVFNEQIHEFHVQRVEECVHDLNVIQRILKGKNKEASLIVSVSPVPLFATFRKDVDVVSANSISKATLRVAAEYFCNQHDNAFYFPSYEIATQLLPNPWESDGRHVTGPAVAKIMNTFIEFFSG